MNQPQQKIEYVNVADLKPYAKNAKKHSKEQVQKIAASIKRFGFRQPVIVDADMTLIAGHGRIEGAKVAGLKQVPAIITTDLTPAEARAYRLADNKLNESDWSMDLVREEMGDLPEDLLDVTGFDPDLVLGSAGDDAEVEMGDLGETSVISFTYPHQEYLAIMERLQVAREALGCETQEELLEKLVSSTEGGGQSHV